MSLLVRESSSSRKTDRMETNESFSRLLEDHGLLDAEALISTQQGTPLRRLATRENWRLDLEHADGHIVTLYLKKHSTRSWKNRIRARLGVGPPRTPARQEAERTTELAKLGIPTMTVAAMAERLRPDGRLISALLTEELTGFQQLDLFLTKRFSRPDDPALEQLIAGIAELAGRFHRQGFNHRDFYSCHLFIRERDDPLSPEAAGSGVRLGRFSIHLIDLQRVEHWPAGLRRRWVVKDLSQLAYSTPSQLISLAAQMRFFKTYLQVSRLDRRGKRLARAVIRRAAALRRKHGPYRPEWESDHAASDSTLADSCGKEAA